MFSYFTIFLRMHNALQCSLVSDPWLVLDIEQVTLAFTLLVLLKEGTAYFPLLYFFMNDGCSFVYYCFI